MDENPLASRLRWARETAGLSARELDRLALIGRGNTTALETRKHINPTASILTPVARVLGVSIDWLLNGDGRRPSVRAIRKASARAVAAGSSRATG